MQNRIAAILGLAAIYCMIAGSVFCQTAEFDQAQALFRQRRWAEAALVFDQLEKAQPGKTDALLYRGKCLVNLGELTDASSVLETYVAAHPQSDDAIYLLAYVRFREGKARESLQLYTAGAKLKTPSADDLKIVALDYVLLNDFTDAAHYLEVAVQMDPGNTEAFYHLGRVRYQQNRFDDSIAAFREVLKRDPGNAKAEDNLGLSLEARNEIPEAIAEYHKAIELDKAAAVHNEQPYLNLGILLAKSNQPAEAAGLLATAEQIDPKSSRIRYELAKVLFSLGRVGDAQSKVEQAIQQDPKDAPAHYLLGRIYHSQGKKDLAAQEFKLTDQLMHAAASDPNGPGMSSGMVRR